MPIVVQRDTEFEQLKDSIRADTKGRVVLGRDYSGKNYRVSKSANGEILLTPVVSIPEQDMWLYKNPQALAAFQQGWRRLAQVKLRQAKTSRSTQTTILRTSRHGVPHCSHEICCQSDGRTSA